MRTYKVIYNSIGTEMMSEIEADFIYIKDGVLVLARNTNSQGHINVAAFSSFISCVQQKTKRY